MPMTPHEAVRKELDEAITCVTKLLILSRRYNEELSQDHLKIAYWRLLELYDANEYDERINQGDENESINIQKMG